MLPNWNSDITLYLRHETETSVQWERRCFSRCFFKRIKSSALDDKSRIEGEGFTVRIPCKEAFEIPEGSFAVLGKVSDELTENSGGNSLLEKYGGRAFRIETVSFNTDFYLPHIRIGN